MASTSHPAVGRAATNANANAKAKADDIEILLNGCACRVAAGGSIAALLAAEGLGERRVAVEVNGVIVPRSAHATHPLRAGDRIEIVHALGGG